MDWFPSAPGARFHIGWHKTSFTWISAPFITISCRLPGVQVPWSPAFLALDLPKGKVDMMDNYLSSGGTGLVAHLVSCIE